MVQWQRLHVPSAGGPGLIPGQGTRSFMLQVRVGMPPQKRYAVLELKIPHGAMKIDDPV